MGHSDDSAVIDIRQVIYENRRKEENDAVADKRQKSAPEPILYGGFDSVKETARVLISKHYHDIASANILFVSRSKASKSGGKVVPGKVSKVSPLYRYLTAAALAEQQYNGTTIKEDRPEADFIMEVALDVWNEMSPQQRTALVDHLLARCVGVEDEKTGSMKYSIRSPQVQEFAEVAERNGAWNDDLNDMRASLRDK